MLRPRAYAYYFDFYFTRPQAAGEGAVRET